MITAIDYLIKEDLGTKWEKYGKCRLYIKWEKLINLEVSFYNTGNISSAYLDGVKITNSKASNLINGKCYIDLNSNEIVITRLNSEIKELIINAIEDLQKEEEEEEITAKEIFNLQVTNHGNHIDRIAVCKDHTGLYIVELNNNETNKNEVLSFPVFKEIDFLWEDYAHFSDGELVIPSENRTVDCLESFIEECIQLGDWEDTLADINNQLEQIN